MSLMTTTSQTVGPYFCIGLEWLHRDRLFDAGTAGEAFSVRGRIIDGQGKGANGAMLEIWQADPQGRYPVAPPGPAQQSSLQGFGRVAGDAQGHFSFHSVKPGVVAAPSGTPQAPHVLVVVFARGLLRHLHTRMYFPGELTNARDPLLTSVDPARQTTLVARLCAGSAGQMSWDIVLQGPGETVFLDC